MVLRGNLISKKSKSPVIGAFTLVDGVTTVHIIEMDLLKSAE